MAEENHPALVLASASPRRRSLLEEAGFEFEIQPSDVTEVIAPDMDPEPAAERLALRKARTVAAMLGARDVTVLGADTVVAVELPAEQGGGTRILGKPADSAEADSMLRLLSSSRHRVITGVAVVRSRDLAAFMAHERTWVTMRAISEAEREAYVASGEWRDKAGGYAIQETADAFVTSLEEGGFDNVVGLPVALTRRLVDEATS